MKKRGHIEWRKTDRPSGFHEKNLSLDEDIQRFEIQGGVDGLGYGNVEKAGSKILDTVLPQKLWQLHLGPEDLRGLDRGPLISVVTSYNDLPHQAIKNKWMRLHQG